MRKKLTVVGIAIALGSVACSGPETEAVSIDASQTEAHAKHKNIQSIEFSGTGRWYQFGQAPNPDLPWPPFDVKNYTAEIDYDKGNAVVKIVRSQVVEAGRNRPAPVEQRVEQYLSGQSAWNIAATGTAPATTTAQPAALEERLAEIWSTPHGFLHAALQNNASTEEAADGSKLVTFTLSEKYKFIGHLNAQHQIDKVQTWIDNPVLGDTLVETTYSDYKDFDGLAFPGHILRTQGGYPVLDINVNSVKLNPAVELSVPKEAAVPAIVVKCEKLANGVFYFTGGTHHSVVIEQKDHVVVVEAPLNEARSEAVIAKVHEVIPNKPIKYLVNTHAHFDHSGGLRTYVDAGATIITEAANKPYYEKVWAEPRSINPDRLAKSHKKVQFETFSDKLVLSDGKHKIELHSIAENSHNDAFLLVYLPKEKILVEADAYTPLAANAPLPTKPNPYSVNLNENIKKLNLKVEKIAALHGPNVVGLNDLLTYIGEKHAAN